MESEIFLVKVEMYLPKMYQWAVNKYGISNINFIALAKEKALTNVCR